MENKKTIILNREKRKCEMTTQKFAILIIGQMHGWLQKINRLLTLIQQGKLTPNQTRLEQYFGPKKKDTEG